MMRFDRPARHALALAGFLFIALASGAVADGVDTAAVLTSFEDKTTVHTLDNGWTFIIVERPVAPVFSFATIVDVGSAQEVPGITGLAHMFEHMAFKGTEVIGTTDYDAETTALAEVEAAYLAYERARRQPDANAETVESLFATFEAKQEAAGAFVKNNEFSELVTRAGGVGMNAFTNADHTGYFYSLPANKIELFAYLESERFLAPVFREFYKERDVVQEERRMRTDSNPIGRLVEQVLANAFVAHPYKQPVVGYMSDLQSFTATDARAFYKKYYMPANMVTAIVGQVDPETLIPMLDRYFGRIPAGTPPEPLRTVEPEQIVERRVTMVDASQPVYLEAYHTGSSSDPDEAVYDAINDILSGGRTSRLYRSMVVEQKIAAQVFSLSGFPGSKYPALWLAFAVPANDVSNEQIETAIAAEIERLKTEDVTDEELDRFKTRAKANLLRGLQNNSGLAFQMATAYQLWGDWREVFRRVDALSAVTKEDIRRVANKTFVPSNRTVGLIVTEDGESDDQRDQQSDNQPAASQPATSQPATGAAAGR